MKTYDTLIAHLNELAVLNSVEALLGWDEQVMLPPAGVPYRAEQSALLARLSHEWLTGVKTRDLLAAAEGESLDESQRVVVERLRKDFDRAAKLPSELVTELTKTTILSQNAWADARAKSDFAAFAPWLEKVVALKKRVADCYGSPTGDPYDALLDEYEPGETAADLRPLFAKLVPELSQLLGRVKDSGKRAPVELLERPLPVETQQKVAKLAAELIGFDTKAGRLDVSVHPFCSGLAPGDTRITTRYSPTDFVGALLGTLHETGHAMYEQGLPKDTHHGTALGRAASLGIHESQSRLWENQVGRGEAFWSHFWPVMQSQFGDALGDIAPADWLFALNAGTPSFIRTESDELTYNLHVALRFDLEHLEAGHWGELLGEVGQDGMAQQDGQQIGDQGLDEIG